MVGFVALPGVGETTPPERLIGPFPARRLPVRAVEPGPHGFLANRSNEDSCRLCGSALHGRSPQ